MYALYIYVSNKYYHLQISIFVRVFYDVHTFNSLSVPLEAALQATTVTKCCAVKVFPEYSCCSTATCCSPLQTLLLQQQAHSNWKCEYFAFDIDIHYSISCKLDILHFLFIHILHCEYISLIVIYQLCNSQINLYSTLCCGQLE